MPEMLVVICKQSFYILFGDLQIYLDDSSELGLGIFPIINPKKVEKVLNVEMLVVICKSHFIFISRPSNIFEVLVLIRIGHFPR